MTLCPFLLRTTYLSFVYSSLTAVAFLCISIFQDDLKKELVPIKHTLSHRAYHSVKISYSFGKILLFSRRICKKFLKILLFNKISCTFWKTNTHLALNYITFLCRKSHRN